ncbi:unnamed protein product [Allacma fusca]|uniref:Uncharacterized protein n=1 Tax=Allacma fusca TaxID=39272 RepID=A0A8J2PAB7_9HEXA|nr:unnamed protein product [Allacma fusca]
MTTKITLILLASWALVFGVEHLGARFITFPGAHGSPVTQKESTQESLQSQVNSFQADPIIGKGQGGHGLPSKAPASRSSHRVKTRQASYDSDYEDVSQPYLGPIDPFPSPLILTPDNIIAVMRNLFS